MKSLHREQPFSYKELLYKCAISLVTVAVIVYFLPKEGKFNYQFDINKPWKYGLLQASFDFPIYKGDEQIQKEQDSLMAFYQPYYEIDKTQGEQMIQKFKDDYNKNLRNIIRSRLISIILSVYWKSFMRKESYPWMIWLP